MANNKSRGPTINFMMDKMFYHTYIEPRKILASVNSKVAQKSSEYGSEFDDKMAFAAGISSSTAKFKFMSYPERD